MIFWTLTIVLFLFKKMRQFVHVYALGITRHSSPLSFFINAPYVVSFRIQLYLHINVSHILFLTMIFRYVIP
jgi:hypothetical protein